jgi:hypothetical protein
MRAIHALGITRQAGWMMGIYYISKKRKLYLRRLFGQLPL